MYFRLWEPLFSLYRIETSTKKPHGLGAASELCVWGVNGGRAPSPHPLLSGLVLLHCSCSRLQTSISLKGSLTAQDLAKPHVYLSNQTHRWTAGLPF